MTATPDDLADLELVNKLTADLAAIEIRLDALRAQYAPLSDRRRALIGEIAAAGQRIQDRAEREGWAS